MTGQGFSIASTEVNTWEWIFPALVACAVIGGRRTDHAAGVPALEQGQDLRQALITIAISVIIADQVIAHFPRHVPEGGVKFGGNAVIMPGRAGPTAASIFRLDRHRVLARPAGRARVSASTSGSPSGSGSTGRRTGMVIRAGVDDRQMTSAIGVNIQVVFGLAFLVGSALAAFGGVVGASQGNVASGQDGQWLLYSLVVVIIGGMGSLLGAAAGSLMYGIVFSFTAVYLPTTGNDCCTQYSVVFTFALLALVLAFRPQGLFGRIG